MPTPSSRAGSTDPGPLRSVLMVASEVLPFAKTGGLADVLSSLPLALGRLGHRVTVMMPRYRGIDQGVPVDRFVVPLPGPVLEAGIWESTIGSNVQVVFVECAALYDRDTLYGIGNDDYADNPRRFGFLAVAALEFARRQAQPPDVIHAHDWQAGLVPVYHTSRLSSYARLRETASIFTMHNLAYQGLFAPHWVPQLGLDGSLFGIDGIEYWGRMSFLKGGINFSDIVTTVSPTYASEIQTPEYGFGFEGILARRSDRLVGVLNGIDTERWDPSRDPFLARPYDEKTVTAGKRAAKRQVLQRYGLPTDAGALRRPLIGMISRMVDQKGLDVVAALGDELARLSASIVVLGTGEPRYQDFWTQLASRYASTIGVRIGFDEPLAHLIEAGADMFLMPSRFEPSGLNQMYSLRYGTVPIVRATGGLDDTVTDYDPAGPTGTGFKFLEYSPEALRGAIDRALDVYRKPREWKALQIRGMREDFSWDRSAREYVKLYERGLAERRRPMRGAVQGAGNPTSEPLRGE